jgi:hypothetical protein
VIEIIKGAPENVLEYIYPRMNENATQLDTEKINYWLKILRKKIKMA